MPPVTARDLQLLDMATIASQMPLAFQNGAVWETFKGECKACGQTLPDHCLRGRLSVHNSQMAVVEASGVCYECKLLTRFIYRLHDDMRITGPRDDRWMTWKARPSLIDRIRSAITIR